jgi:hypothetical protein
MKKLLVLMFLILAVVTARAEETVPDETAKEDLSLPVPTSEMKVDIIEKSHYNPQSYINLDISTWNPDQLSEPSELSKTTDFHTSSRKVGMQIGAFPWETKYGFITPQVGFSYAQMSRSGNFGVANTSASTTQDLNIYQGMLGVEWTVLAPYKNFLAPYASLNLSPFWLQATSSEFNTDGVSHIDWAFNAQLGLNLNINFLANWLGMNQTALQLGAERIQSIHNSGLSGWGFVAGTRVGWM